MISVMYATVEPPTDPLHGPTGIPFSQHQHTSSDIKSINPIILIFLNTRISSLIRFTYSGIFSFLIIPALIFSCNLSKILFFNTSSSLSYNFGYFTEVSSSKSVTESAITFVFSIACRITSNGISQF